MLTVRRWYIYLVSALSIQALTWALIGLSKQFIEEFHVEATAFAVAVIVVSLPIYLVHWLWATRLSRTDAAERESAVRWFYLYAMQAAFLIPALSTAFNFLALLLGGADPANLFGPTTRRLLSIREGAQAAILAIFWIFHWYLERQASVAEPVRGTNATMRRLYLLGFSGGGLLATVWGVNSLLRIVLGTSVTSIGPDRLLVADEIARLLIAVPLWLGCWVSMQRLYASGKQDERESALRKFYLYLVIGIAVVVTVTNATMILAGIFRGALGLPVIRDLREPVSWMSVWAVVWAYHAAVLEGDRRHGIGPSQAAVARLYRYIIAGIALAVLLGGIVGNLAVIIRTAAGEQFGSATREALAWFSAAAISGLGVWILPWRLAQRDATRDGASGAGERRSAIRKLYLYLYVFAATVSVLGGAIYIVFRLLRIALGDRISGNLLADLGVAFAFIAVAVGVWLYHGTALRGDGTRFGIEKADRLANFQIAVVDVGPGAFGSALLAELRREFPSLALVPVGLSAEALQAMGGDGSDAEPLLARASLIVGPWQIAVPGAAGGSVTAQIAAAVASSPARKLLLPTPANNWDWIGGESGSPSELAHETTRAVKQVIEGEDVKGRSAPVLSVIGVVIGLCALLLLLNVLLAASRSNLFD